MPKPRKPTPHDHSMVDITLTNEQFRKVQRWARIERRSLASMIIRLIRLGIRDAYGN